MLQRLVEVALVLCQYAQVVLKLGDEDKALGLFERSHAIHAKRPKAELGAAATALSLGVVGAARKPREGEAFASVDAGVACRALAPGDADPQPAHVVDVLVADDDGGAKLACVPLVALAALSAVRVFMPPDLRRPEARARVRRAVDEVARRFAERREAVPELDDARDLGLDGKEAAYGEAARRVIYVNSGTVALEGLTITRGSASGVSGPRVARR